MQWAEPVMGTVVSFLIREATERSGPATATGHTAAGPGDKKAAGAAVTTGRESVPAVGGANRAVGTRSPAPMTALQAAIASLHDADDVFSTWKADSPMSRLRRAEIRLEQAPREVAEVLALCENARDASGGWFDPWRLPGGVDPTGLVKGWAAQRALGVLQRAGVPGAMVNAGGDIAVFGEPGPGRPWRIGIRDPRTRDGLLCVVAVRGPGAVATSGTYERGAHIVDPLTGRPATSVLSATVAGPDLSLADALANALVASDGRALEQIVRLPGYSALVVARDFSMRATSGFPGLLPAVA
jgi:FAD:protein FMN transferase